MDELQRFSAPVVALDRDRSASQVMQVAAVALDVLRAHGVNPADCRRARGWSNLTWVGGGVAIRVAATEGEGDLLREADLVKVLPVGVGHPTLIDAGRTRRHEWMLMAQAPGTNLEEVWPKLDWPERVEAVLELWRRAAAIHAVPLEVAGTLARSESPFHAPNADRAHAQVDLLVKVKALTPEQARRLQRLLDAHWKAMGSAVSKLCHGDLVPVNALWHHGHVSALLDLEFAVVAPVESDALRLLDHVFGPLGAADHESDTAGLAEFRRTCAGHLHHLCDQPGVPERLVGYAVLFHIWAMTKWLKWWDGDREHLLAMEPHIALSGLATDGRGFLAPLLDWSGK